MILIRFPDDFIDMIVCGDCIKLMSKIPENSIDLVITSPPYNLGIDYGIYKDNMEWNDYFQSCRKWIKEIFRILKKDGRFCLNHYLSLGKSNNRQSPLMDLNWIAKEIGFKHHGLAVWTDKTLSKRTAWGSWLSASAPYINSPYEGILLLYKYFWKKQKSGESTIKSNEFMEYCSGIWNMQPDIKRLTPASFPLELPLRCIKLLSFENDIVLDPFMGSGTTAVACKQLKRNFIGFEINPDYCKIARNRVYGLEKFIN